jgi:DNA polymerase III alpha subunit (gram-positive type)
MAMSKPMYVFSDIETESLKGHRLLQIAAVTENNQAFSIYINPQMILSEHCTELTGLYFNENHLFKNGRILHSVPIQVGLKCFKKWIEDLKQPIRLVFHNAFAFDIRILLKHYKYQKIEFPVSIITIHDTLPMFRKLIEETEIPSFKLADLAEFTKVILSQAHNAVFDAKCLKEICENYTKQKGIDLESILVTSQKPIEFFQNKLEAQVVSKQDDPFPSKNLD